ncbi:MAG: hypothetical protein Q7W02_02390 [Candidatus Rokubacteria bacterium]|nr:hypothetical protein [Candidatus Rokubacteria bacterium]
MIAHTDIAAGVSEVGEYLRHEFPAAATITSTRLADDEGVLFTVPAAGQKHRLIVSLLVLRERTRLSLRAERVGRALRKAGPQPVVLTCNVISGHSRTRIQDGDWPAWLRRQSGGLGQ